MEIDRRNLAMALEDEAARHAYLYPEKANPRTILRMILSPLRGKKKIFWMWLLHGLAFGIRPVLSVFVLGRLVRLLEQGATMERFLVVAALVAGLYFLLSAIVAQTDARIRATWMIFRVKLINRMLSQYMRMDFGLYENAKFLPTRNFHGQKFAGADTLSGQALHALIQERGGVGKTSHACMPGCVIRCSNVVPDQEGAYVTAGLEYETIALTGSNLCIDDLDTVAKINAACNDIGIDTIETGAVIGVAMEAGLLPFGDGDGVLKLLEEIRNHTEIGKLLGEGTYRAGKHWGVKHLPVINKQAFPAYDPRTVVPMGITYATSPMGADHTYGPGLHAQDPVEQTRQSQRLLAKIDSLGICMFARVPVKDRLHLFVDMINARYGWDLTEDWLDRLAEETLRNEQDFNQKAGFTKEDYRMPDAFTKTGIPATGQVFSIDPDQLDQLRQWDD